MDLAQLLLLYIRIITYCFASIIENSVSENITRVLFTQKMNSPNGKLRMLCLHGYQQNAELFRVKIGSLRKIFKNSIDFHFLDAPHKLDDKSNETESVRGWWIYQNNTSSNLDNDPVLYTGFEESLKTLQKKIEDDGPFDGLMGFSQGAALSAIFCANCQIKNIKPIKFVILVSGFKSRIKAHQVYYENPINIPSLHVLGTTDELVSKERGEQLFQCFDSTTRELLLHAGGHYVPAQALVRPTYIAFIHKYGNHILEDKKSTV